MMQLSQTLASLEQHPNNFNQLRLKAQLRVAQIKALRNEPLGAFVQVKTCLLGAVLENSST